MVASTPAAKPAAAPRRAHSDSVNSAFNAAFEEIEKQADAPSSKNHGVSTAEDLASVRGIFNDVAVVHVAQVRDVMLELRYGDADPAWIEATRPALKSLRAMAGQMELADLCNALDEFCAAVDSTVANRGQNGDQGKAELLRRYQRLIDLIPQAFELDAERDRREPIIIESLLFQVEGVERLTIDKLLAVGLNRLDALMRATADELAVVSGIRREIADAIVEKFRTYRSKGQTTISAPDPAAERRELADLLIVLSLQNDDYSRAASLWTDAAKQRKRELLKQREQTFQRIKVTLARLGERDQLARLEKLPFAERIAMIDRYLSTQSPSRATPPSPASPQPTRT